MDPEGLSEDELRILKTIQARQMLRTQDTVSLDDFSSDNINGYSASLKTGHLTLVKNEVKRDESQMKSSGFDHVGYHGAGQSVALPPQITAEG